MALRPTELGWKGGMLLVAMTAAFFASAYNNLFFLLLVFCGALGALDACWAWRNVRGVAVQRLVVAYAAAGVARPLDLALGARRPRHALDVALVTDAGVLPVARVDTLADTSPIPGTVPARPRGVAAVRAVRIASRFPLGLFAAQHDVPVVAEIVTGPDPSRAPAEQRPLHEHGHALAGVRPFRGGDAIAHVHWKATARRGEPVVKEFSASDDDAGAMVVDRRVASDALESALAAAAGRLDGARAAGRDFALVSQDAEFCVRAGGNATDLQRWLATAGPLPATAPPPGCGVPR